VSRLNLTRGSIVVNTRIDPRVRNLGEISAGGFLATGSILNQLLGAMGRLVPVIPVLLAALLTVLRKTYPLQSRRLLSLAQLPCNATAIRDFGLANRVICAKPADSSGRVTQATTPSKLSEAALAMSLHLSGNTAWSAECLEPYESYTSELSRLLPRRTARRGPTLRFPRRSAFRSQQAILPAQFRPNRQAAA
jgi:hypothetical protein